MKSRRLIATIAVVIFAGVGCADTIDSPDKPGSSPAPAPSFGSAAEGKGDNPSSTITPESCPGGAPKTVEGRPAAWTLVIWQAADNNLEEAIVDDLNEMERGHGGSPNVNVLVQLDRRSEDGSWRYEVQPGDDPDEIESKLVGHSDDELDSGNWKNYAAFGEWATVCYPAERYMTVVEGHGGGWSPPPDVEEEDDGRSSNRVRQKGDPARLIAPDDTNGSEMSIPEMQRALAHFRKATERQGDPSWMNRLSIYGSDACLMQTVEVLRSLHKTARFIVGSAENEPGPGWPYYTVIDDLTTRPYYYAQSPGELAGAVVSNYGKSYGSRGGQGDRNNYTLTVADNRHVDSTVDKFAGVSELLLEVLDEIKPQLKAAREDAVVFADSRWSSGVYVDAAHLLADLRDRLVAQDIVPAPGEHWEGDEKWRDLREAIETLLDDVDRRLITDATFGSELEEGVSGLSVFAPTSAGDWRLDFSTYAESRFAAETKWDEVIELAFIE